MISPEKGKILTPFQKLAKTVGDLGKLIVAKGFKNLPKVQYITQFGHTDSILSPEQQFWLRPEIKFTFGINEN